MILTILESILLIVNAIAILNEKRFLKKCKFNNNKDGFDTSAAQPGSINEKYHQKINLL